MKKRLIMLTLLLTTSCGYSSFPLADRGDYLLQDLEDVFNLKGSQYFSLSDLDYYFIGTPFRLEEDQDNYSYTLDREEGSLFRYCPGKVSLYPDTKNVFELKRYDGLDNVSIYAYDVKYKCNRIGELAIAHFYIAFASNQQIDQIDFWEIDENLFDKKLQYYYTEEENERTN